MSSGCQSSGYVLGLIAVCLGVAAGVAFWASEAPPDAAQDGAPPVEPEPEPLPLVVIPVKRPFKFCASPREPNPAIAVTDELRRRIFADMNARDGFRYLSGQVYSGKDGRPTLYADFGKGVLVISAPGAFHEVRLAELPAALAAYHGTLTDRGFRPAAHDGVAPPPPLKQTLPSDHCPSRLFSEPEHAVLHHTGAHAAFKALSGHASPRRDHPVIYAEGSRLFVLGRQRDDSYPMMLSPLAFRAFAELVTQRAPARRDGGADNARHDASPGF